MKKSYKNKINNILICMMSLILLIFTGLFFYLSTILASAPEININDLSSDGSTRIFDADGEVIMELGLESRENISYDQIPQVVIDAFLSVEDSRFFKHNGFDLPRFMKSALVNLSAGSLAQGGSTLTMQMVDVQYFADSNYLYDAEGNIVGTPSSMTKIENKIREIFMSFEVESKADKTQILEFYLNRVNFGGTARGIQKGAEYYFSKDVSELTLSEAAFLAGVVNAPNYYNPYNGIVTNGEITTDHYQVAVDRRNETLRLMNYHGYISDEEYKLALSDELAFQLGGAANLKTTPYQGYVDVVVKEVKELTGKDPYTTPMDIYTHMDRDTQDLSDSILNGEQFDFTNDKLQTGFTAIENKTGAIVAIGAGRGYGGDVRYNRANDVTHNTGSCIKPILDYTLAFDYLGWSTSHVIEDKPIQYAGTDFTIRNADGKYRGQVDLQYALVYSLNTTAIMALEQLIDTMGKDKVVDVMHRLGYSQIDADHFSTGYAIGGSDMVATPTQMAGAFATLGNNGNYITPHTVSKIEYHDGSEVIEPNYQPDQVYSPEAAYMMTKLLIGNVDSRYGLSALLYNGTYQIAAKTGTSDWGDLGLQYGISEGAMKDKWVCGYTSDYSVTAWAGFDNAHSGAYFDNYLMNVNVPGQITNLLLDELSKDKIPANFVKPDGVVSITHINGLFPYTALPEDADKSLQVTGLIKKDFANLKDFEEDELDTLSSFDVTYDSETGSTNFIFTPYSDPSKLTIASKEIDYGKLGTGKRIFDKSFVFGAVNYKVDIYQDDEFIQTLSFSEDNIIQSLNYTPGSKYKFVGYYGFTNSTKTSNKIDKELIIEDTSSELPEDYIITAKNEEGNYILGNDYQDIFNTSTSYLESETKLNEFMINTCPDVIYEIQKIESTNTDGSLNESSPQLGSTLIPNSDTYIFYINTNV